MVSCRAFSCAPLLSPRHRPREGQAAPGFAAGLSIFAALFAIHRLCLSVFRLPGLLATSGAVLIILGLALPPPRAHAEGDVFSSIVLAQAGPKAGDWVSIDGRGRTVAS